MSASIPSPSGEYLIAVSIGLALMLGVSVLLGLLARKKATSFEHFLVGHRDIGPIITGLALSATWLSGWAALGMMGVTYAIGWAGMWFAGMWSIFGIMSAVYIAGPKVHEFVREKGVRTVPEILGARFESKIVQSLAALIMSVLMLLYAVGQYKAAATCWYAITGLPAIYCLLLSALAVLVYMAVGGYTGTQWALALQGALVGLACFILGLAALSHVGGPSALNAKLAQESQALIELIRRDLPTKGTTQLFADLVGISSTFFLFVSMAMGFPHNIARFLGMRKVTAREYTIMALVVFAIAGPPIFLNAITGLAARATFGPALLRIEPWKGDLAAPYMAMISGGLPLATLYIVGLFAAALSTLSAMVLIMATSMTRDIIQIWKPDISDRSLMWATRALIAIFVLIPLYWTLVRPPELLAVFMGYAAIGLGAIFAICLTGSLYWNGATREGVIACMIYGFLGTLLGGYLVSKKIIGMGYMEYAILLGCLLLYVGVSKLASRR